MNERSKFNQKRDRLFRCESHIRIENRIDERERESRLLKFDSTFSLSNSLIKGDYVHYVRGVENECNRENRGVKL